MTGRHRLTVALALAVIGLITAGALVTSNGAGLSVPNWPLSYGTLNPPGWWQVENVRAGHGHRLSAGVVALAIPALAVWTWRREHRRWVRTLFYAAVAAVLAQAVLGGGRLMPRDWSFAIGRHNDHRVGAALVALAVGSVFAAVLRGARSQVRLLLPSVLLALLVCVQIALGGAIVLTGKAVTLNTLHAGTGATIWVLSVALTLVGSRMAAAVDAVAERGERALS